ncbi:MAG: carboxypeptidase regulatory-like domain-containing protein [Anaerolineales bacterium]|nr:carboxypeptidase regulatory-like domain-containing protein [Anaerolineales bacterium]
MIAGLIADHTGKPAANIRILLTGGSQTLETVSRADGGYRFDKLPAGTYNLELPAYGVKQSNVAVASGQEAAVNLALPVPPRPTIVADIVRGAGLALLVGDWGKGNVPIRVTPPGGVPMMTITGSKREYGPGGFEVYATKIGTYIVEIEGYRFDVPMNGQFTRLVFRQAAGPVQPSGIIEGALRDHQNKPVAAWFVQLSGNNVNLTATTNAQGVLPLPTWPPAVIPSLWPTVLSARLSPTTARSGSRWPCSFRLRQ